MRKSFQLSIAVMAAVAMLAGGCGGSDEATGGAEGTDSPAVAKPEFLKQGNAICAKANKQLDKDFEKFVEENNFTQENPLTNQALNKVAKRIVAPIVGRQIEEIRDLGAPSGDEREVEAILAAAEEGIQKGEQDPTSLTAEDGNAFSKANRLSREYGLQACSE